jgi:hypothetical protein
MTYLKHDGQQGGLRKREPRPTFHKPHQYLERATDAMRDLAFEIKRIWQIEQPEFDLTFTETLKNLETLRADLFAFVRVLSFVPLFLLSFPHQQYRTQ